MQANCVIIIISNLHSKIYILGFANRAIAIGGLGEPGRWERERARMERASFSVRWGEVPCMLRCDRSNFGSRCASFAIKFCVGLSIYPLISCFVALFSQFKAIFFPVRSDSKPFLVFYLLEGPPFFW